VQRPQAAVRELSYLAGAAIDVGPPLRADPSLVRDVDQVAPAVATEAPIPAAAVAPSAPG
jgi:hypothetical protein